MDTARFELTASPHIKGLDTTPGIMWSVVKSLIPVILAALWYFGPSAILVISASTLGCVATERALGKKGSLGDGSATITGILLGLTLPAGLPMWMAFLGGVFAIGFGKLLFGGLGQNPFNPALLGRAFLQAAFPEALTTWADVSGPWLALRGDNFALPLMAPDPTATITGATPLGLMKFEGVDTELVRLMIGSTSGSLGETAAIVILLCGAWLALKKYLEWRVPIAVFISAAVLSQIIHAFDPAKPGALFTLFSGGLVLGAVYMATDMVTSPTTPKGAWVYGAGIGALVVLIRFYGGLPEGVMYAILIMNALTPFINQATQPRLFGTGKEAMP